MKLILFLFCFSLFAKTLETNSLKLQDAPDWLNTGKLEAVTGRIQNFLEWDIRKIQVYYHKDDSTYQSAHRLNFLSDAFFKPSDQTIHLSHRVNEANFERIFGHELVHAIFYQKYKGAIPLWLEEGLANYIGKSSKVDYAWLSTQKLKDVTQMKHANQESSGAKYHYLVSTALIEMIASKCSLKDLLQLSVGAKLQTYLETYCEIKDLNTSFQKWVTTQSGTPGSSSTSLEGQSTPWWKKDKQKQWWQKEKQ